MTEGLRLDKDGDIARLRIVRPDKKNAITYEMWAAIPRVVAEVEADSTLRVLLVEGEGPDFSAGADISEFGELRSTAEGAARYDEVVDSAVRALSGMSKPSIASIGGNCIGGGCQLAVACDFRFARQDARFGITPAKLGIVYDFRSTRALVALIGPAHARYLLLSAKLISAARAAEIGLVNEVLDADDPHDHVMEFARTLGARSQTAVRGMNEIIGRIADGQQKSDPEVERIRSEALYGNDYAEGVAAFLERRSPRFTDG